MQVVINIDEEIYKRILPYKDEPVISNLANDYPEITHAIANGTPLPKGHGKLVDKKKLGLTDFEIVMCEGSYKEGLKMLLEKIENAPTIIEADEVTE